jgi:hypothetical protein
MLPNILAVLIPVLVGVTVMVMTAPKKQKNPR